MYTVQVRPASYKCTNVHIYLKHARNVYRKPPGLDDLGPEVEAAELDKVLDQARVHAARLRRMLRLSEHFRIF